MIIPLFSSLLIQKFGLKLLYFIFITNILLGQISTYYFLVFTISSLHFNFNGMIIGRFIYGFGGESFCFSNTLIIN